MITNVNLNGKTIFVTGAAGFIGANLIKMIYKNFTDVKVIGIDCMNDYYDVSIKDYRLSEIEKAVREKEDCEWDFIRGSIADKMLLDSFC